MNKEIYVEDPRPNNDSSIGLVPHLNTYADILTHFGSLTIDQSQGWDATPIGEGCWKVVGFHVTIPQVVIAPKVLDLAGNYIPDKLVYWHYTGAPTHLTGNHRPKYFGDRGLSGRTKAEGNGAEFVITKEHWMGPGSPGPDSVWVAAEPGGPQYSDVVHGLGMRGGTNHLIVSPIFRHVIKGTEQDDGPGVIDTNLPITDGGKPIEEPVPDDTGSPITGDVTNYELIVIIDGQEVGRIPIQNFAPVGCYVALTHKTDQTLLGYMPLFPGGTAGGGLAWTAAKPADFTQA